MAKIKIKNLKVKSLIGVYDFERETKCELIFNIELDYDASRAGQSDDIAHAIDYGLLANKISDFVSSARFFLLEKLAHSFVLPMQRAAIERLLNALGKPEHVRAARGGRDGERVVRLASVALGELVLEALVARCALGVLGAESIELAGNSSLHVILLA